MSRCCVVPLKRREGVSKRYLVCLIPAMAIDCSVLLMFVCCLYSRRFYYDSFSISVMDGFCERYQAGPAHHLVLAVRNKEGLFLDMRILSYSYEKWPLRAPMLMII